MVRLLAASAAVALLAACAPSGNDSPAPITLSGAVVDAAGAPLTGATVTARPPLEVREIDTSRLLELDALGFACIDERPPEACSRHRRSTETGELGRFSVGAAAEPPAALLVAVRRPPGPGELSGPALSHQVSAAAPQLDLGAVTIWNPVLALTPAEAGDALLQWDPPPPAGVARYHVLVEGSDGRLVWSEVTPRRELRLLHAQLQGTRGALSVVAMSSDGAVRWRSARVPYRADAGAVTLAAVDEVDWPVATRLRAELVLVAIGALFIASLMLVLVSGARQRQRLAVVSVLRALPRRR